MIENINLLRLACLIQDRNNQDFKRVVLSIIFELLYENNNEDLKADELYKATITKSNEPIERDFFDELIGNSKSFEVTNTQDEPFVKLTIVKFQDVEKNISEFSIEPSINSFLSIKRYNQKFKKVIIGILYQSIYENIYAFNPANIDTLVPNVIKEKFTQKELNLFNEFLEHDDPQKNRRLYNQFVKAIEFAILTSGKGVKEFTDQIYSDKTYILDTNIIFRMLGVGGVERKDTILRLIKSCIKQGVNFEFTINTYQELNNTLEASINKISIAERTKKIEIIQELVEEAPHFFNDDFIIQYSRLKNRRIVNSPEQYGIEMKTRFKQLCTELNITQSNHKIKIEHYEINLFSKRLISERKKITSYRYSNKQAVTDAYNVLYVRKVRGNNNYNYSEVKSFYLTTDRGLNKILSNDNKILIPATILPSQLFAIHNPLTDENTDVDYENFFSFIKRRTSEFKHRGRDVFSFIQQARLYTTDKEEIKNLIKTFSDERYTKTKKNTEENVIIKFKDFSKTYFDGRLNEIEETEKNLQNIEIQGRKNILPVLIRTKNFTRIIELAIYGLIIPVISISIGLITNWVYGLISLVFLESFKFFLTKKENFAKQLWEYFYINRMKRTPYYQLTKNDQFINKGLEKISDLKGNVWK